MRGLSLGAGNRLRRRGRCAAALRERGRSTGGIGSDERGLRRPSRRNGRVGVGRSEGGRAACGLRNGRTRIGRRDAGRDQRRCRG